MCIRDRAAPSTLLAAAPLAQRQSNGLLIRRFWVRNPGGAPHREAGQSHILTCFLLFGPQSCGAVVPPVGVPPVGPPVNSLKATSASVNSRVRGRACRGRRSACAESPRWRATGGGERHLQLRGVPTGVSVPRDEHTRGAVVPPDRPTARPPPRDSPRLVRQRRLRWPLLATPEATATEMELLE